MNMTSCSHRRFTALLLALILSTASISLAFAQVPESEGSASQYGSIDIDLSGEQEKDSYSDIQAATIAAFDQLRSVAKTLASGGSAAVPTFTDDMLSYLSGVYLYCAVNNGTCPLVLEGILETDIINSKSSGAVACPHMKRFWNVWVASDMEERHKFLVKTSFINSYSEFNAKTRPKFLRCEDTIKQEISGPGSGAGFFRDRYRAGAPKEKIFDRMYSLLTQVREKIPNVFAATGSQPPAGNAERKAANPKSKGAGAKKRPPPRR